MLKLNYYICTKEEKLNMSIETIIQQATRDAVQKLYVLEVSTNQIQV
jgi:hypothetical protein